MPAEKHVALLKELTQQLAELSSLRHLLQKEKDRLAFVQEQLVAEEDKCISLEKQLRKERKEYERLTRLSIQSLFYTILQSAEKQKEKELQEYLAAELKWQQSRQESERLQEDAKYLAHHIATLEEDCAAYPGLYKQKEQLLLEGDPATTSLLLNKSDEISVLKNQIRELQEAAEMGHVLRKKLKEVTEHLNSASGWGTWDMLGGGLLTTAIKRGRMDDAREAASEAQHLLVAFNKELGDIGKSVDDRLNMGGFTGFADYFFDGLIADWMVQSSINDAYTTAQDFDIKIHLIITDLNNQLAKKKEELAKEEAAYTALVETA